MVNLQLPRNYGFISRLPDDFELEVLKKGNETADGTWYNGRIGNHEINLLSKVNLVEGQYYKIHKKNALTLELGDKVDRPTSSASSSGSGEINLMG